MKIGIILAIGLSILLLICIILYICLIVRYFPQKTKERPHFERIP